MLFRILTASARERMMKRIQPKWAVHVSVWCVVVLSVLACVWSDAALAAAPQVKTQGPGFYRIMLGGFEVTALLDGTHPFPIDTVVEGVPKAEIARDLQRDFLEAPVQGSINAFLINTGSKLILIDTGAGVLYGDCCGKLLANLRSGRGAADTSAQGPCRWHHFERCHDVPERGRTDKPDRSRLLAEPGQQVESTCLPQHILRRRNRIRHVLRRGRPLQAFQRRCRTRSGHSCDRVARSYARSYRVSRGERDRKICWCGVTSFMWRRSSCRTRRHRSNTTPTRPRPRRSARAATRSSSRRKNRLGLGPVLALRNAISDFGSTYLGMALPPKLVCAPVHAKALDVTGPPRNA